jgi:rod shape-determining protein MreD
MARLHSQPICVASGVLVPLISLAAPSWLSLGGVFPSWAVLWLLPWALVDGPVSGVIAGAAMGLVLDGLSVGDASQVPALMLLGWWWGRLGRRGRPIQRSLNLGLLAWIGTIMLGLTIWAQLLAQGVDALLFQSFALQTCLAQGLITGLMAPMVGSLQLLIWRRRTHA